MNVNSAVILYFFWVDFKIVVLQPKKKFRKFRNSFFFKVKNWKKKNSKKLEKEHQIF